MSEVNAISALAARDLLKFLRDPVRLVSTLIFPLIFIVAMGGTLQANLGAEVGYNFLVFIFTGVYAQTLFDSSALGLISLIEDRENDFSQEIFVSPISRYSIIFGKILGESLVALSQGLAIVIFGLLITVPISGPQLAGLVLVGIIVCLLGGSFGVIMMATLNSRRAAQQVFPFILLPQYFVGGVFAPIKVLPWYLDIFSRIAPLRYAVDLMRGIYYAGQPEYDKIVLQNPLFNLLVIAAMFFVFLVIGTFLFVRGERNR
jgi:ABC-2 type transport system permease protein